MCAGLACDNCAQKQLRCLLSDIFLIRKQETGPANPVDRAVGLGGGGAVKGAVPVAVHLSRHELRPSTSEPLCRTSVRQLHRNTTAFPFV